MLLRTAGRRVSSACRMAPVRLFAQQKPGPSNTKPPSSSNPPSPPPPSQPRNNNPSSSSKSSEGGSWAVEKPAKKVRPGETRTAVAAYDLYQYATQNNLDVRLLSEIIHRWNLVLKSDPSLETFFLSEYDPNAKGDKKQYTKTKLTEAQIEACSADKARVFRDELVPQVFSDIIEARGGTQELDVFLDTYLFMVENGKTQYLKQFEEEFSRLTSEGYGEIPVTVTTAFELSEEQKALVQAQLEKKAIEGAATPVPVYKVNPSIMGGVHINWNKQHEYSATTRSWFEDGLDHLKKGVDANAH